VRPKVDQRALTHNRFKALPQLFFLQT